MQTVTERARRSSVDKFAERRRMLADAALAVLAAQGYANTGLRDIAEHSKLSHGSLHYYFDDKSDLIAAAVWQFKSTCARRYDDVVATAGTPAELVAGFGDVLSATLSDEAELHRVWYDVRNQAQYDDGFRETVEAIDVLLRDMVWAVVLRHAELVDASPTVGPEFVYAAFDGVFQAAVVAHLRGDDGAAVRLREDGTRLLAMTV